LICNAFAGLSGNFYNKINRGSVNHRLEELINEPNTDEIKFNFFYNSAKDYFSGNVFWYMYDIEGEVVSLFRINQNDVRVQRDVNTNEKLFYYNGNVYKNDKILHIPSRFNYDGLTGHSIFDTCRTIFNNAANIDSYVKNTFNNSVGQRLIIDISSGMPDITNEQIEKLKEKFVRDYAGIENAGMPLIKRKGMEYSNINSGLGDNRAQQLEENRKFQEKEIAKILGVPMSLLNGEGGGDMETLYTLFLDNAVKPLATAFEQSINRYLLSPIDRQTIYFEYNYNSLLRVNTQTRIDTYIKEMRNGILTPNEVREKENLSLTDQKAGDNLYIQANLMPLRDEQIEALLASARLKLQELSHSDEFHSENPKSIGDDKL
jgi:HK97 family phage portal protein